MKCKLHHQKGSKKENHQSQKNVPKNNNLPHISPLTHSYCNTILSPNTCQRFRTVPELLQSYELPGGIFPNNVQSFSCNPLSTPGNPLSLVIRLRNACTVTKQAVGVTNTVRCQQQISGIVSAVKSPISESYCQALNEVRVDQRVNLRFVQFFDDGGIASPPFPIALIPNTPPSCVNGHQHDDDDDDENQQIMAMAAYFDLNSLS
ncbi:TWiK family of potassium channels protein 18 [Bienertia sinuspersici]